MVSIMRKTVYAFEESVLRNSDALVSKCFTAIYSRYRCKRFRYRSSTFSKNNQSNIEQPIAYYSRSHSKAERKYAVTRKEMLALVDSLKHFCCYLLGKTFQVRIDHSALQWLRTFKEPVGQVAR